jgi:hypothetical protein
LQLPPPRPEVTLEVLRKAGQRLREDRARVHERLRELARDACRACPAAGGPLECTRFWRCQSERLARLP